MTSRKRGRTLKIGVVAGTPIDVKFGIEFLENKGYTVEAIAISRNPLEQTVFQTLTSEKREIELISILEKYDDCDMFLFYCNSLSSTVDVHKISEILKKEIITPLGAYSEIRTDKNVAIIAANAQSLAMIESIIYQSTPCRTICMSNLAIVEAIENKNEPDQIIIDYGIDVYLDMCNRHGVDKFILGCTHFDYLEENIQKYVNNKGYQIEIITPKKFMHSRIKEIVSNNEGKVK